MAALTLLDPISLIGREFLLMLERLPGLGLEPRFFHTAEDEEHQIAEFAGASALVPPLASATELDGSSIVVTLGDWDSHGLDHLEDFLDGAPETAFVDAGRVERLWDRTQPFHRAPTSRPSPPSCRVAHPGVAMIATAIGPLDGLAPVSITAAVVEPASSFGQVGVDRMAKQAAERLSGQDVSVMVEGEVLAFNTIALPAGHLIEELTQVLGTRSASVSRCVSSCFHGHQVHIGVTFSEPVDSSDVLTAWQSEPRLAVMEDQLRLNDVVDSDVVLLGPPQVSPDGLAVTTTAMADGLRVGEALTALEIVQALL